MSDYFGVGIEFEDGVAVLLLNGTIIELEQKKSAFLRMLDNISAELNRGGESQLAGVTSEQIESARSIIAQSNLPP